MSDPKIPIHLIIEKVEADFIAPRVRDTNPIVLEAETQGGNVKLEAGPFEIENGSLLLNPDEPLIKFLEAPLFRADYFGAKFLPQSINLTEDGEIEMDGELQLPLEPSYQQKILYLLPRGLDFDGNLVCEPGSQLAQPFYHFTNLAQSLPLHWDYETLLPLIHEIGQLDKPAFCPLHPDYLIDLPHNPISLFQRFHLQGQLDFQRGDMMLPGESLYLQDLSPGIMDIIRVHPELRAQFSSNSSFDFSLNLEKTTPSRIQHRWIIKQDENEFQLDGLQIADQSLLENFSFKGLVSEGNGETIFSGVKPTLSHFENETKLQDLSLNLSDRMRVFAESVDSTLNGNLKFKSDDEPLMVSAILLSTDLDIQGLSINLGPLGQFTVSSLQSELSVNSEIKGRLENPKLGDTQISSSFDIDDFQGDVEGAHFLFDVQGRSTIIVDDISGQSAQSLRLVTNQLDFNLDRLDFALPNGLQVQAKGGLQVNESSPKDYLPGVQVETSFDADALDPYLKFSSNLKTAAHEPLIISLSNLGLPFDIDLEIHGTFLTRTELVNLGSLENPQWRPRVGSFENWFLSDQIVIKIAGVEQTRLSDLELRLWDDSEGDFHFEGVQALSLALEKQLPFLRGLNLESQFKVDLPETLVKDFDSSDSRVQVADGETIRYYDLDAFAALDGFSIQDIVTRVNLPKLSTEALSDLRGDVSVQGLQSDKPNVDYKLTHQTPDFHFSDISPIVENLKVPGTKMSIRGDLDSSTIGLADLGRPISFRASIDDVGVTGELVPDLTKLSTRINWKTGDVAVSLPDKIKLAADLQFSREDGKPVNLSLNHEASVSVEKAKLDLDNRKLQLEVRVSGAQTQSQISGDENFPLAGAVLVPGMEVKVDQEGFALLLEIELDEKGLPRGEIQFHNLDFGDEPSLSVHVTSPELPAPPQKGVPHQNLDMKLALDLSPDQAFKLSLRDDLLSTNNAVATTDILRQLDSPDQLLPFLEAVQDSQGQLKAAQLGIDLKLGDPKGDHIKLKLGLKSKAASIEGVTLKKDSRWFILDLQEIELDAYLLGKLHLPANGLENINLDGERAVVKLDGLVLAVNRETAELVLTAKDNPSSYLASLTEGLTRTAGTLATFLPKGHGWMAVDLPDGDLEFVLDPKLKKGDLISKALEAIGRLQFRRKKPYPGLGDDEKFKYDPDSQMIALHEDYRDYLRVMLDILPHEERDASFYLDNGLPLSVIVERHPLFKDQDNPVLLIENLIKAFRFDASGALAEANERFLAFLAESSYSDQLKDHPHPNPKIQYDLMTARHYGEKRFHKGDDSFDGANVHTLASVPSESSRVFESIQLNLSQWLKGFGDIKKEGDVYLFRFGEREIRAQIEVQTFDNLRVLNLHEIPKPETSNDQLALRFMIVPHGEARSLVSLEILAGKAWFSDNDEIDIVQAAADKAVISLSNLRTFVLGDSNNNMVDHLDETHYQAMPLVSTHRESLDDSLQRKLLAEKITFLSGGSGEQNLRAYVDVVNKSEYVLPARPGTDESVRREPIRHADTNETLKPLGVRINVYRKDLSWEEFNNNLIPYAPHRFMDGTVPLSYSVLGSQLEGFDPDKVYLVTLVDALGLWIPTVTEIDRYQSADGRYYVAYWKKLNVKDSKRVIKSDPSRQEIRRVKAEAGLEGSERDYVSMTDKLDRTKSVNGYVLYDTETGIYTYEQCSATDFGMLGDMKPPVGEAVKAALLPTFFDAGLMSLETCEGGCPPVQVRISELGAPRESETFELPYDKDKNKRFLKLKRSQQ